MRGACRSDRLVFSRRLVFERRSRGTRNPPGLIRRVRGRLLRPCLVMARPRLSVVIFAPHFCRYLREIAGSLSDCCVRVRFSPSFVPIGRIMECLLFGCVGIIRAISGAGQTRSTREAPVTPNTRPFRPPLRPSRSSPDQSQAETWSWPRGRTGGGLDAATWGVCFSCLSIYRCKFIGQAPLTI